MRTVVIYKSKTGFTKKYAEWIAEELSADIFNVSKAKASTLTNYDTIIYGGSLHASSINGIKFIIQNMNKIKDKKVVVFATGASVVREDVINEVANKNFTMDAQKYIKFFYLRGGFNYSKLSPFDKMMISLFRWILKRKQELSSGEKGMLALFDKPVDYTMKENINEIITYVNS